MKKLICGALAAVFMLAGCAKADTSSPPAESEPESALVLQPGGGSSQQQQSTPPASSSAVPPASSQPEEASSQPQGFRLTIPEGYTLARIGMILEEKGVCTTQEFIDAAQAGDYSGYSLIAQQAYDENRCFKLEGYLFPDTYDFSAGATADDVIRTMLNNMEKRMSADLRNAIAASGYSVDQILAMASIIEKEALGQEAMSNISSVLHNRLAVGMQLQTDVTIKYVEGAIKPFITGDVDRYNSYYNTYKCPALPAGAICNPGMAAINAALNPASTNYYYFLTDADGNYYWAETFEEHNENRSITGV